jgi:hypothetical protein
MKVGGTKKIIAEDFNSEDRALASQLGASLNPTLELLIQALNNRINITDNLDMEFKTLTVRIEGGQVAESIQFQTSLQSVSGIVTLTAVGTNGEAPDAYPFIYSFATNGSLVGIQGVTGLISDATYVLTVLVIGI